MSMQNQEPNSHPEVDCIMTELQVYIEREREREREREMPEK